MFVIVLLTIWLQFIALTKSDNCDKLQEVFAANNIDSDDLIDYLKNYKNTISTQTGQITNNFFLFPISQLNNNKKEEETTEREISEVAEKQEPVFRDFEATELVKHKNVFKTKKPNVMRKSMYAGMNDDDVFDVTSHKNWNLIPKTCGASAMGDRITGGEDATLGQYPWMARIGFINSHKNHSMPVFRCGGSLITKTHVITAAHCVTKLPPELRVGVVRLGEYNTVTPIDCIDNRCADKAIDVKPRRITVHEDYGSPTARNDIALIRFKTSVTFTEWVSTICLPYGAHLNADFYNKKGEVAGWGFYDINVNRGSDILQTVVLPILKSQPCMKVFHGVEINSKFQFCVGGDLGKDSCNGDSGGPLMKVLQFDNEPKYTLLGIVSLGAKYCGLTTTPAIYTRVTYYVEWILDNL